MSEPQARHDEAEAEVVARAALRLIAQIRPVLSPLLAGHPPQVQAAALADLTAIWLGGHLCPGDPAATAVLREKLLDLHVAMVRALLPVNAAEDKTDG